jgi:hypothetical protein
MVEIERLRKRPLRVTIIGILCILAGMIYLFPVLGIFDLGNLIVRTGQTVQVGPLILTALAIAIANIVLGIGCLIGWRPIWIYLVIISVINFVVGLLTLLSVDRDLWGPILTAGAWFLIATYVMLTLQSKKTRLWFRI